MNVLGVNVSSVALGIAAGTAVTFVAFDVLGSRTAPPSWRRAGGSGPAVAPTCITLPAAHHGGVRKVSALSLIVLHSTEGGTAKGAAGWFQSPDSKGSTHIVVGEDGCYRTLDDLVEPWGAAGANHNGLHIEMAGYAKWSRAEWLAREKTLALARAQVGAWSAQYGIPLRFVNAAGLKRGDRGVTTHVEVTKAFAGGVGHWDPGPNFPVDAIIG